MEGSPKYANVHLQNLLDLELDVGVLGEKDISCLLIHTDNHLIEILL